MLLIEQRYMRGGLCHYIFLNVKANKKYMKDYYKNKELSYIGMLIIYMDGQCRKYLL